MPIYYNVCWLLRDILSKRGVVFLSGPYEIYTGLAVEFEDPFGNRLGITDYSKQANRVSETAAPTAPRLTARVNLGAVGAGLFTWAVYLGWEPDVGYQMGIS